VSADARAGQARDASPMKASYAVTWCNGNGLQATGRLELGPDAIQLDGTADGEAVHQEIPYRELASVAVGRGTADRIGGRQALVLGRTGRTPIRVAGVAEAWIVSELAERLASLHVDRRDGLSRLAVVVPLKDGARAQAKSLLERGAPFDPEEAGLARHTVLLGDRQVVFLFEAEAPESIERIFGRSELWNAAEAWKDVVAGPACVTEVVYEWERAHARVHGLGF
jgi:hypothetical protein